MEVYLSWTTFYKMISISMQGKRWKVQSTIYKTIRRQLRSLVRRLVSIFGGGVWDDNEHNKQLAERKNC